eukprot:2147077-Karenia_brevis.AAC.1
MASGGVSGAFWGHFPSWVRKWLQEAFLKPSAAIFWPGPGNGSRMLLWSFLRPFSGLGPEIAPGSLSGAFW